MPYIERKDLKMYYEDVGIGEPVVFFHGGFSRGIISFAAQMSFFQATAEYRCILPDLRGFGRTISNNKEWSTPQLAGDIIFLMDELKLPKAHLVGHSLGGDVALYFAVEHSDRCFSITSIGSTGAVNDDVLKSNEGFDPNELVRAGKTNFIELLTKTHYDSWQGDWKSYIRQVLQNTEKYPDFSVEDLKKIVIPTLLILGDQDKLIHLDEITRLKDNIADFRVEIIKEGGHSPHTILEKPMKVNEILYNYFKQIEG